MAKNHRKAINKIAKELGRIMGSVSLPKIFPELQIYDGPYKITKQRHILELLNKCKSKKDRNITLQKILKVHTLGKDLSDELGESFRSLGFIYKNGILLEKDPKSTVNHKAKILASLRKYSKNSSLISEAIYKKGEKLSFAYLLIYLIENHLRLFIWKIAGKSNRKLSKLLNRKGKSKIKDRQTKESINKWLSLRKDSNLFYLDIEDLGNILQGNWAIFQNYFPNEHWIKVKIDELSLIRNRVAHNNSFITDQETKVLELYSNQIFEQIK